MNWEIDLKKLPRVQHREIKIEKKTKLKEIWKIEVKIIAQTEMKGEVQFER